MSGGAIVEDEGNDDAAIGMARALGYAQIRSLTAQLLGGPAHDPEALVGLGIRHLELAHALGDLGGDALVEALIDRVREETIGTIITRTRAGKQIPTPWRTASHALIFGGAEWFEAVIDAGARAVPLRHDHDPIVLASTCRLAELARTRRDIARRRHADTAPIVRGPAR